MNELNVDGVLWWSIAAIVFSIVALFLFSWKAMRGIEGLEKGKDTVTPVEDSKPEGVESNSST